MYKTQMKRYLIFNSTKMFIKMSITHYKHINIYILSSKQLYIYIYLD